MALKFSESERKRRYYLEHKEKIKKRSREYYATKVKPKKTAKTETSANTILSIILLE